MKISSVVVAAGSGRRFGSKKQFEQLNGKLVIDYSIEILREFGEVVIVGRDEDLDFLSKRFNLAKVTSGGRERMHSVFNGVLASEGDFVLIHDAARPLIDKDMVSRLVDAVKGFDAAIVAIKAYETLKLSNNGFSVNTLDRDKIYISQTPQAFRRVKLLKALEFAINSNDIFTDEAALWEKFYGRVKIVEGSRKNIKITTKEDLRLAECLLG
ncbi:2-C-methyl-D-erythritol 4-phosphate cytidylyltransferase [Hippea maritima]|uniref:2-C-methyl-D-erythritol 4-phosphate cytidylyltransferase n=1 Tax=Hippea maritima (strain ATCC 700847 / DSM 10411 / MH2) TaxID=760142 RepID=F2LVF5_HIPMA|nr:2-C-methyl-D-erythritol 4-phosphate cytidylyltransferase [Hippea maritima]AEA33739.1 2-C-methyl-D-erythritol 4-phosphate cytidylyltransferase [Hippea maritima DSM 10411]